MTSQIRVDEITNRSGLGTVTIYDNGFEFTGVTTFTEDVDITGGLTIGGVLTYEDVTNIDSVGVVTARAGVNISGGNFQVGGTTVINSGRALYNLEEIKLADTKEIVLGSSDDLKIYHSGSHSFISEEGAGALKIKGDDIRFETAAGTEFVNTTSAGQITVGGAVFNYQGTSKPHNNNAGTLWGTANIALTGQWSSINWPSDHSDPEPSQPWYMMGRPHGSTDKWALSIRPGSSNALYRIIECDNDSNGYISNLKFHTSNGQERLRISSIGHLTTQGNNQGNSVGIEIRNNNTNGYSHAELSLTSQNATTSKIWCDVPNAGMRLNYNGGTSVKINQSGNLVMASGSGIDFTSTSDTSASNASASSELLDDYEEGTWTPRFINGSGSSANISAQPANRVGTYCKIGNTLFFSCWITGSLTTTETTSGIRISGLPYNSGSNGNAYSALTIWNYSAFSGYRDEVIVRNNTGNDQIIIQRYGGDLNFNDINKNGMNFMVSGQYRV